MKTSSFVVILVLTLSLSACTSDEQPVKNISPSADTLEATSTEPGKRPVTAEKINLNTATTDEFKTVPGVGDRMAREFDEYRPYASILEFRQEMGKYVDQETIAGYEDHVYVPIDFNESDAATVAQILGLDLAGAEELVSLRPFADEADFIAAVTDVAGGVSSQFARLYLAR